ncbi:CD59 glycoprotein-like [Saccopteryx leptura]|uniref:CD59 glycoprotein-like n=1 Tax=Saccopteryx leptura TaxID=249018 RepID=UPI00339BA79A
MESKGRFFLPGLLLILSVLCQSGYSLQCYTCLNPGGKCTNVVNCTANHDACLHVKAETRSYYQCWRLENCNFDFLKKALGEKSLTYNCCQNNLCNGSDGMSKMGSTILLVTPLLAAFWSLFI